MTKLEIIEVLQELEIKRLNLENLKTDSTNYYLKGMDMVIMQEGTNFNQKYQGESIPVNIDIFRGYIEQELAFINEQYNEYVKMLSK